MGLERMCKIPVVLWSTQRPYSIALQLGQYHSKYETKRTIKILKPECTFKCKCLAQPRIKRATFFASEKNTSCCITKKVKQYKNMVSFSHVVYCQNSMRLIIRMFWTSIKAVMILQRRAKPQRRHDCITMLGTAITGIHTEQGEDTHHYTA